MISHANQQSLITATNSKHKPFNKLIVDKNVLLKI